MVIRGLWSRYMCTFYDKGFRAWAGMAKNDHGAAFFSLDEYRYFTRQTYEHFVQRGEDGLKEMAEFHELQAVVPKFYGEHAPTMLAHMSDAELRDVLEQAIDLTNRVIACTIFSEGLDHELVATLYREVMGSDEGFERFFEAGSRTGFPSFVALFDSLLLDHANAHKHDYDLQWLFANYWGTVPIELVNDEITNAMKDKGGKEQLSVEIDSIHATAEHNTHEREEVEKTLSPKCIDLFRFMEFASFIRDDRKQIFIMPLVVGYNVARQLFRNANIRDDDIAFALPEELLSDAWDPLTYENMLADRRRGVVVRYDEAGNQIALDPTGSEAKKFFQLVSGMSHGDLVHEIRGQIASRGMARGRAVVILNEKGFGAFRQGDVIITSMTRPEFVPILKNCAAIVTDEGGITCHAAIISRELKIPCIIGTKIATQVLHDGGLVEVDAERGIVTKLESGV